VIDVSFAPAAAVATGIAACATDLAWRRIPNLLTFGSAGAGMAWHLWSGGIGGAGLALAGWTAGLALLLPLYLLRSIGAGDVKLLAAFGAWLGPMGAVLAGLYGTVAAGVLALVLAAGAGYLGTAYRNLYALLMFWRVHGVRPMDQLTLDTAPGPRLARAVPMLAGVVVAIWQNPR
jgi:prepilin peptidase CpaA